MNVYLVEANTADWDEFYSCVVVAMNERAARAWAMGFTLKEDGCYFAEHQYPLKVTKIELDRHQIIAKSFNGL